jgi:hypothetical protein
MCLIKPTENKIESDKIIDDIMTSLIINDDIQSKKSNTAFNMPQNCVILNIY